MTESVAIALKQISKCYRRYTHPVDRLKELLIPSRSRADEFWALRDINLEVFQGETLGIVGQNGSGKSTLLQIVAGTLTPTGGEVHINGRVSALLELGSGFNPEFTGRQNVFFNGRILGLSRDEIAAKFDAIAAFAEIGVFINQPVKTYSTGMFVRLAFAVAVNVKPQILIIDEALSVGDIYFQQKCFEKLKKLKEQGVTLLFVSHDSGAIYKLCDRAIFIESGLLVADSKPKQIIDLYEARLLKKSNSKLSEIEFYAYEAKKEFASKKEGIDNKEEMTKNSHIEKGNKETLSFDDSNIYSDEVIPQHVCLLDESGQEIEATVSEQQIELFTRLLFIKSFYDPHVGFKVRDRTGEVFFETNTYCMGQTIGFVEKNTVIEVSFKFCVPLAPGEYTMTIGIADSGFLDGQFKTCLSYIHDVKRLNILQNKDSIKWSGMINLCPTVDIRKNVYASRNN